MKKIIFLCCIGLMAGCSSALKETVIRIEDPAGTLQVKDEAATAFRTPERVAVYGVGRTRDAVDPNVLHLEHQVVRVEKAPTWIKLGATGEGSHYAVVDGPSDPLAEKSAEPTAADLEMKVQLVDKVMEKLDERNTVLVNKLDSFAKATEEANRLKEENVKLRVGQDQLRDRLEKLEEKERNKKPWWKLW